MHGDSQGSASQRRRLTRARLWFRGVQGSEAVGVLVFCQEACAHRCCLSQGSRWPGRGLLWNLPGEWLLASPERSCPFQSVASERDLALTLHVGGGVAPIPLAQ